MEVICHNLHSRGGTQLIFLYLELQALLKKSMSLARSSPLRVFFTLQYPLGYALQVEAQTSLPLTF